MRRFWLKASITAALLLVLAACGRPQRGEAVDLALRIDESGFYELSYADLSEWGWDLSALEAEQIELNWGAQPIPFALVGNGKDQSMRFYGHVEPSRFADYSVYHLRQTVEGNESSLVARSVTSDDAGVELQGPYTLHSEYNSTYLTQAASAEPWLGDRILAPGEISTAVAVPALAGGRATLVLQLWSASQSSSDPDHHLVVEFNGTAIGDLTWDGMGMQTFTVDVPQGVLVEGENQILLQAPGDTGARAELTYLDWLELTYNRLLHAEEDRLSFSGAGSSYELSGFLGDDIELWDVTDPQQPSRLEGYIVAEDAGTYHLRFSESSADAKRYVAAAEQGFIRPTITTAFPPFEKPTDGADYIVIVPADLQSAVEPLLAHRRSQGLRTAVVTTQQIWDRFNQGVPSAEALTDFLRWAAAEWPAPAPRYVLLAGDASYDPLNYLGDSSPNLIPTLFRNTLEMGEAASDNALADIDADGLPDFAIGRLPAQTPEDLEIMVSKILAYERDLPTGEWLQNMLFVADDDDPFFHSFNEQMLATIPENYATTELVIGEGEEDTRDEFLGALNDGQRLVSYMGHGAVNIWAQEEIFNNQDITELEQQGRLPFVVVWACLSGFFHHPQTESLGETLLLAANKGAVAALVPTGQTFATDQQVMAEALFDRHLFTTPTVGDALLASFRELNPERPGQRDIINTFVLLGDPALPLFANE